jgi:hypothetical protein
VDADAGQVRMDGYILPLDSLSIGYDPVDIRRDIDGSEME